VIWHASHSAVGWRVTSNHSSCRRPWPKTRNANNRSKVRVGTTQRSMAAIACAWFRKECLPALRGRPTLHHVFRDRRLGDLKAEHQQLAMDPRCSPVWVFLAHASDEIAQLASDLWPPIQRRRHTVVIVGPVDVSECRLSWPHDAVACSPSCAADWLERVIIFVARSTPTSFCREILASRKRAATILAFLYAG
jgi:hypothetical protein